jgi:hypothetical protein
LIAAINYFKNLWGLCAGNVPLMGTEILQSGGKYLQKINYQGIKRGDIV